MKLTNRICKKCLTRDMDESAYFQNMYDYIAGLNEDIKTSDREYEKRLSVCRECERLLNGLCNACGCYVEMRAAVWENRCPYSQW